MGRTQGIYLTYSRLLDPKRASDLKWRAWGLRQDIADSLQSYHTLREQCADVIDGLDGMYHALELDEGDGPAVEGRIKEALEAFAGMSDTRKSCKESGRELDDLSAIEASLKELIEAAEI